MSRMPVILALAIMDATMISLVLSIVAAPGVPWLLLFATVAAGWLADSYARRLPPERERPALAGAALFVALVLIAVQLRLGLLQALAALLPGAALLAPAYLLLVAGLFLFWRGTRLDSFESGTSARTFGRGVIIFIGALLIAPLTGRTDEAALNAAITLHLVAFTIAGLFAMALAQVTDAAEGRKLGWRWLATLALAITLVVLLGVALAGLAGGGGFLAGLQILLALLILPIAFIAGLLAELVVIVLGPLIRLLLEALRQLNINFIQDPATPEQAPLDPVVQAQIDQVVNVTSWLLLLVPVVLLLLLLLFLRRRRRRTAAADEERESLDAWGSFGSDLRDLLATLRSRFTRRQEGLRGALAALIGTDPASRVRRAYIRMLITLEERRHPRPSAQTPAEYESAAAALVGEGALTLTAAYEQARYNPAGPSAAEAERAEKTLTNIK